MTFDRKAPRKAAELAKKIAQSRGVAEGAVNKTPVASEFGKIREGDLNPDVITPTHLDRIYALEGHAHGLHSHDTTGAGLHGHGTHSHGTHSHGTHSHGTHSHDSHRHEMPSGAFTLSSTVPGSAVSSSSVSGSTVPERGVPTSGSHSHDVSNAGVQ